MCRIFVCFVSIVVLVGFMSPLAFAQEDETFDFDGMPDDPNYPNDPNNQPYDPTDWMTRVNWSFSGVDTIARPFSHMQKDCISVLLFWAENVYL